MNQTAGDTASSGGKSGTGTPGETDNGNNYHMAAVPVTEEERVHSLEELEEIRMKKTTGDYI